MYNALHLIGLHLLFYQAMKVNLQRTVGQQAHSTVQAHKYYAIISVLKTLT